MSPLTSSRPSRAPRPPERNRDHERPGDVSVPGTVSVKSQRRSFHSSSTSARRRNEASASRTTVRSSKGWTSRRSPGPARGPCRRSTTTSPVSASGDRALDRAPPIGVDLDVDAGAWSTSWMIASGSSGSRVVRGHDREVGMLGRDLPHQRALARDRGRRPRRRRRSAGRAPRSRAAPSTVASESGVCA